MTFPEVLINAAQRKLSLTRAAAIISSGYATMRIARLRCQTTRESAVNRNGLHNNLCMLAAGGIYLPIRSWPALR